MSYPATAGGCVDQLYRLRQKRLALQKKQEEALAPLKEAESSLEDHIIETFSKQELESVKGKLATASLKRSRIPKVEDLEKFVRYVVRIKAFDLLTKSCACQAAVRERWEDKKTIPGLGVFVKVGLSLTKAR